MQHIAKTKPKHQKQSTQKVTAKSKLSKLSKALLSGLFLSSALLAGSAYAQVGFTGGISGERSSMVRMPNADFVERVVDLRVKVLGGEVKLERVWIDGSWRMNEAWSNLTFYHEEPEATPKIAARSASASARAGVVLPGGKDRENKIVYVGRGGTMYEKSDDNSTQGVEIYTESLSGHSYIRKTEHFWQWYDREGNWINYDKDGRMLGYGDRNGINISFMLDGSGRRMGVKDHHGNVVLTFMYDGSERLIMATDNHNRKVTYHWVGDYMMGVTDVEGHYWAYGYDKNGDLAHRIEPDGAQMSLVSSGEASPKIGTKFISGKDPLHVYPQNMTVSTKKKGRGNGMAMKREVEPTPATVGALVATNGATTIFNIDYNTAAKEYTVAQIDELGKNTTEVYDEDGQLLSRKVNGDLVLTRQYSGNHSIQETDERGLTTSVSNNEAGKPTRIVYADGSAETYTYDNTFNQPLSYVDQLGIKTEWTYDSKGNALTRIDAVGKPEERLNRWTYDHYGQALTYTLGEGVDAITTHYTYDANGNIKTITDPMGHTTQYTHNPQGQVTSETNALGHTWKYEYTPAGHLKSVINPAGDRVNHKVNALGRTTEVIDALGQGTTLGYSYTKKGLTITQTNALGNQTFYQFNPQYQLISTTQSSGNISKRLYDAKGRLEQQVDEAGNIVKSIYGAPNSPQAGQLTGIQYPTYIEHYQYNAAGQITEIKQALNQEETLTTRMNYDALGQILSITEPDGATTQLQYDAFGHQTLHVDALGGKTTQSYDLQGNVTRVTDAKGNIHRFEYDKNGNLTQEISPTGQVTSYTYDAAGQLVKRVNATGNRIEYSYTPLGLVKQEQFFASGQNTPEQTISYTYDKNGQLLEVSKSSTKAGDVVTRHVFTRDAMGQVTREDVAYGQGDRAITKTLRYAYDADGNTVAITYPDGSVQSYTYEQGLLKSIQRPDGKTMNWSDYRWYEPTKMTAPGITQNTDFDALQRITEIQAKGINDQTLMQRSYGYDVTSNITQRGTESGAYNYRYDLLDRLKEAIPPQKAQEQGLPVESYAYDAVHNRIGSSHQAGEWFYNEDNQLLKFGTGLDETTYTYTANGHLTTETQNGITKTYHYDATDRLVRITQSSGGAEAEVVRYAYDPMGRRISKTVHSATTYYLYTDEGLIAELNEGGEIEKAYGWIANTMYGTSPLWQAEVGADGKVSTAQFHTLLVDHLGTPQMAVNEQGEVTWKAVAESFGQTYLDAENQITMNLRFPGQYYDEETGTHYNYFRDYNPATGRYAQRDSIGLYGGINVYGYARRNPQKYIDPNGTIALGFIVLGGITLIAIAWGWWNTTQNQDSDGEGGGFPWEKQDDDCPQWNPPKIPDIIILADPPEDAHDPEGAKAPGKPGDKEGFKDPKGGEDWVRNPHGQGYGWRDKKGHVWVPTGQGGTAHGGPHWDVQDPTGKDNRNVYPGGRVRRR